MYCGTIISPEREDLEDGGSNLIFTYNNNYYILNK